MEPIKLHFDYRGAEINAKTYADENYLGTIYPIELNNSYSFTLHLDENEEWGIMRENNGIVPAIENDLLNKIIQKLKRKLRYTA